MKGKRLTASFVARVQGQDKPKSYGDECGLILRVMPSGSKQWIQRLTIKGKRKRTDKGLGGYPAISLAKARRRAYERWLIARGGGNPDEQKTDVPTFQVLAEEHIENQASAWRGDAKKREWESSLRRFVYPTIGERTVDAITSREIFDLVKRLWQEKPATARKVLRRISSVMRLAIAKNFRLDDPAAAIESALPKPTNGTEHHKALPHSKVGAALRTIRASGASKAVKLAFEFLVLTAAHGEMVVGARWEEMDTETAVWTVPGERMKSGQSFRIPLSARALEVLHEAQTIRRGEWVFPGQRGHLSREALSIWCTRLRIGAVPHGFRSSFRDWAAENEVSRDVAESALGHVVSNQVEAAYRRTDLLDRRRPLMEEWGDYVSS